jgi:hypothetical protein
MEEIRYDIQHLDSHVMVEVTENPVTATTLDALLAEMEGLRKGFLPVVLQIHNEVEGAEENFIPFLEQAQQALDAGSGILVVVGRDDEFVTMLDEAGVMHAPSTTEAIDLAMMEQMSRDLGSDEEE